jgi:glycine oxidase
VKSPDVLIIGGGVIGLSLAMELRLRGREVLVLERDRCGQPPAGPQSGSASAAAAGMLAGNDAENPLALQPLAHLSLGLYPLFLERIAALSGQRVPFLTSRVIEGFTAPHPLRHPLTPAELAAQLPQLSPNTDLVWQSRDEHSLEPRTLCNALIAACRAEGVEIHEHERVNSLTFSDTHITAHTTRIPHHAAQVVITAGAWSAEISPELDAVIPRRGHMLVLEDPMQPQLDKVVRAPGIYIVPRGDGRLLVGSTVEHAGFDVTLQPQLLDALHLAAVHLIPELAHAARLDAWAGLRPGTPDGLPILGPLEGPRDAPPSRTKRLFTATGHFRNGILLAPATAHILAQLLHGEPPAVAIENFAPARFSPASPTSGGDNSLLATL